MTTQLETTARRKAKAAGLDFFKSRKKCGPRYYVCTRRNDTISLSSDIADVIEAIENYSPKSSTPAP